MSKTKTKKVNIPKDVALRMKKRPYYAFLYAKNMLHDRLPEKIEEVFCSDAQCAYLYARYVVKGRLPDFIHTALLLQSNSESKEYVAQYLKEFC